MPSSHRLGADPDRRSPLSPARLSKGLAFSHDEPELKDLYLALLASSMDARTAVMAHPAFSEGVRQLTSEEARLLRGVLAQGLIPAAE
ncbi:MAG: Abi-alpha family protein, partial [Gemmatimonadales bacterium]